MFSCVFYKGLTSSWFPVLQGTRQGGVWSPFLYLCYINELIDKLISSRKGLCIDDVHLGVPSFADDMCLVSLSNNGLQSMINECFAYASQWRFQYNPLKSAVIVLNEITRKRNTGSRKWFIGNDAILEVTSYPHLGVTCDKSWKPSVNVKEICNKLRSAFFSIIFENGLCPKTNRKIYYSVVLPKALYGTECLHNLSHSDMLSLERVHRLCVKYIQGFHIRTRTDVALSMLNVLPIEAEIHKRKLNFLGQACRLERDCSFKQLFLFRLTSYALRKCSSGFIPDIMSLLEKYHLKHILENYIETGIFPSRYSWKKIVNLKVKALFVTEWEDRTSSPIFDRFRSIHNGYELSNIWEYASSFPSHSTCFRSVAQLISGTARDDEFCRRCNAALYPTSFTDHVICDCPSVGVTRKALHDKLSSLLGFFKTY